MEEASVAGESPDRSKQRESSAEPTSGSAGPVPETRDPRLAITREDASPAAGGGVDTATRVLSVPGTAEDAARGPAEAGDGDPDGRDDSAVGADGDGGRLREAEAAWVRPAEPAEDGPVAGGTGADEDGDGAGAGETGAGEDASDESAADGRDAGAAGAGAADGAGADDAPTDGGQKASEAGTGAREDAERPGTAGAEPKARTDALDDAERPAADAGEPETGDTGAGARTDAQGGSEAVAAGAAKAGHEDRAEDAKIENGKAEDAKTEDAKTGDAKAGDAKAGDAKAGDAKAGDAKAESGERADDGDGEDGDGEATGGPREAAEGVGRPQQGSGKVPGDGAEPKSGSAAAKDSGKDSDERPATDDDADGDGPAPAPAVDAPKGEDGRQKPDAAADSDDDTDTSDDSDDDADDSDSGDAGRPKGPVDQPTAVFRTGRPSAPAVDQPTTMLKLGGARPSAGSESDAERTSKFVALKGLDDPGVRQPPRGADVTASVPQLGPERTTQQPLPPKPPLDLLAELTNTPPPPQTPLRTAVRRIKIWTPLVLLLVIVFAVVQNFRPLPAPTLELTAEDSHTFEGGKPDIPWPDAGQAALDVVGIGTFGSSGEQKPVPIASVAKVMTAYLILRDHPLKSGAEGPMIGIDALAEKQSDAGQESTVTVTEGDEISQREAIEAILIASANNVARLLARWDAGSEKAFVEKMNEAAKDLGMTNTTYTDPSGLNDTTVSTAVDQVKLARAAMKQPAFREVAAMMSYDDYKGVNHPNWNQLVGSNGVVGIKTGTTTSALGNLVFAAKKEIGGETRTVVGAVVRQPAGGTDNTILSAALTAGDALIRAAQGALESATILEKGTVVGYVDDGLGGRAPVVVTEDVKAVGWAGLSVKLTFAGADLPHSAKAGTEVGTLTVGDGTSGAVKVPVALKDDLVEPGFTDKLTRIG
ncbi:D-alanyl-D-alanine carboxypeptidase [Streptomyces calvus]|nr:D-alanyl-D-alanine carboxypeptidase [Streptomyces calvus]MBA8977783.1 D-alanyl-D-alanine carboxypeptidase [Streptomyces calvus]